MKHFRLIRDSIDVAPLLAQLDAQPELWDQHRYRTLIPGGPFAGTSDLWLRWRALDELGAPVTYREPHWPVFYPAWHALPALRPVVADLVSRLLPTHLGAILMSRIPAGGAVMPHHDRGGWHAEFHRTKLYIPLCTNAECVNYCGGERVVMDAGSCWFFDNLVTHSVVNGGETDRVTLIVCMRTMDDEGA